MKISCQFPNDKQREERMGAGRKIETYGIRCCCRYVNDYTLYIFGAYKHYYCYYYYHTTRCGHTQHANSTRKTKKHTHKNAYGVYISTSQPHSISYNRNNRQKLSSRFSVSFFSCRSQGFPNTRALTHTHTHTRKQNATQFNHSRHITDHFLIHLPQKKNEIARHMTCPFEHPFQGNTFTGKMQ